MTGKNSPHRLYRNRRSNIAGLLLASALIAGLTSTLYARVAPDGDPQTKNPLPVVTTRFEQTQEYSRELSYLGLVKARRRTDMAFEISGLMESLQAREGNKVEAGQILATLDDSSLLARKKATLAEQRRVASELELAILKEDRQLDLRDSGAVSREAYDETRLRAQALAAQSDAVAAQLDSIDIELSKTVLRAPYAGVISERIVDVGTVVSPGSPILRIVESGKSEAYIGLAVELLETLEVGEFYTLKIRDERLAAPLLALRPDVNPVTRAVTAVFALPGGGPALDGEPVSLELEQSIALEGGWLPLSALLEGERGAWTVLKVQSVDGHHNTVREVVEVLEVRGNKAYVRGTIADGDIVIADGIHKATPGAPVTLAQVH
jgi:membrane fusion protein, multidrug efflux system